MTDLEIAVSEWSIVRAKVAMDNHPSVWVGHYSGDQSFGSMHATRPVFEAGIACVLLSPFAMSPDISDSFLIVDRPNHIWVARLSIAPKGTWTTTWRVGYSVWDDGSLGFDVAERLPLPDQGICNALLATVENRDKGASIPFGEAYWAAAVLGHQHENQGGHL